MELGPDDLEQRLREADSDQLLYLLRRHSEALDVPAARQALRNPYLTAEAVGVLLSSTRLLGSYEIRRELAKSPKTPEAQALRFVPGLYWRDLAGLGRDVRARPTIRRAADNHLVNRLPSLAEGERIAIARTASHAIMMQLRFDGSPRVIAALLENPRMSEGLLVPLVNRTTTRPEVLNLIAANPRWGVRYDIRLGLCRNPNTPVPTALRLLPGLKRLHLQSLIKSRQIHASVRRRAEKLMAGRG